MSSVARAHIAAAQASVQAALAALVDPPAPGPSPPPVPPPAPVVVYGGSYPPSHDPACDVYPGGPWGPHHGHVVRAPGPGRVEAYSFPTPLDSYAAMDLLRQDRYQALFTDYVCGMPDLPGPAGVEPLQTMSVAVYWPDQPLPLADGSTIRAAWGGHVHPSIPVGRVQTGDPLWTSWDTGIRFEARGIPARAAHVHCCGSRLGQLSPNGDVPGALVWQALTGQAVERIAAPGPDAYQGGRYCAGRLRQDFVNAGQAIPPVPS